MDPSARSSTQHDNFWIQVQAELQRQVARATFDAWLSGTAGRLDGDVLTISTSNSYGLDWLEHRLASTIERAAAAIAGRPIGVKFELSTSDRPSWAELELSPVRMDDYARTVRPDRVAVCTQYFRQSWLPILGPVTWCVILELRQRCYFNATTGERRDTCKATYNELASSVGVSVNTIRRALNPDDPDRRALIDLFIIRREVTKRHSPKLGGPVNEAMLWQIRLDEPILPKCQNGT